MNEEELNEDLKKACRVLREAREAADEAVKNFWKIALEELKSNPDVSITDLVKMSGYTREHISKEFKFAHGYPLGRKFKPKSRRRYV